ncbi:hypothetical protein B9H02_03240 [Prosthecochloris sp. HL-130-GSB]|nr:hypothetical protein B9H02_03240 [Prosthecochloris sp. HL-130-GSB]
MNCRSSVEIDKMISKPEVHVAPGLVWSKPVYESGGIRRRGSVSVIRALISNCGNLRRRCQAKSTSPKGKAESSDASPRDGTVRSSEEATVMVVERRDGVIRVIPEVNRESGRSC